MPPPGPVATDGACATSPKPAAGVAVPLDLARALLSRPIDALHPPGAEPDGTSTIIATDPGTLDSLRSRLVEAFGAVAAVYVVVRPRDVGRVLHRARALGAVRAGTYLHIGRAGAGRSAIVPITREGLGWATRLGLLPDSRRADAVGRVARPWMAPLIARATGSQVGMVLRTDAQRDPAQAGWRLHRLAFSPKPHRMLVVDFESGGSAPLVVKLYADPADSRPDEMGRMRVLRADVEAAGATMPAVAGSWSRPGHDGIALTDLDARPLAHVLRSGRRAVEEWLPPVTRWLADWNRRTLTPGTVSAPLSEAHVLDPARAVAPLLADGARYRVYLEDLARRVDGMPMPLVATHGDLTTFNVLPLPRGRIAVLDWESSRPDGAPLGDLLYFAVDALAARAGFADRVAAATRIRDRRDPMFVVIGRHVLAACRQTGIEGAVAEWCFHACWLHHAANEARRAVDAGHGPFVGMLQRLCVDPALRGEEVFPWRASCS